MYWYFEGLECGKKEEFIYSNNLLTEYITKLYNNDNEIRHQTKECYYYKTITDVGDETNIFKVSITPNIISDNLWKSMMKIPLKDLRFYGNSPYKWKIILTRYFEKSDEFYSFPYGTIEMGKDYYRTAHDVIINEGLSKNKSTGLRPVPPSPAGEGTLRVRLPAGWGAVGKTHMKGSGGTW